MPSRVIRSDVLSSRSLSRVSWQADWLWMRLLIAADEFGRMDGRAEVIRAECFPARPEITPEQIEAWLAELASCDPGGIGPLLRYAVDGWPYLQLANWEKHRAKRNRAESSKFPDPPSNSAELRGILRNESENVVSGSWGLGFSGSGVLGVNGSFKTLPTPVAAAPADVPIEATEPQIRQLRADPSKAQARLIWPECQAAAARHGRRWDKLSESRLKLMAARLREFGPDPKVLVKAIDGAIAYWKACKPKDADLTAHLMPETIYAAANFAKYIETAADPKAAPPKKWSEMTIEEKREFQREAGTL